MKGKSCSPSRSSSRKQETTFATLNRGKAKERPAVTIRPSTPTPTNQTAEELLQSPQAEEPPEGITREDFQWFLERTENIQTDAGTIPFETGLEWFDRSIRMAEKATNKAKCGGVISN